MIFNYAEETKNIETVSRYNGGWLKTVTGLDKSVTNGFSILGKFVDAGDFLEDYKPGLYLDCSKDGSRKHQEWNYHLFRVDERGFTLIKVLEDAGRHFAVEFWEPIEQELHGKQEVKAEDIVAALYKKYDVELVKEVAKIINEKQEE